MARRSAAGAQRAAAPCVQVNYSHDAGQGSAVFAEWRWRQLLLGGAAASALVAGMPRSAQALSGPPVNCTSGPADVLNCSGDQSQGLIVQTPVYSTVNVGNLTTDIAPPNFVPGIAIDASGGSYGPGTLLLNSDLGSHEIRTTNSSGISVTAPNGVTIVHRGNVTTSGDSSTGISAYSSNDVSITSTADVATNGEASHGIVAMSAFGNATIVSTGDVSVSQSGTGILGAAGIYGTKTVSTTLAPKVAPSGDVTIISKGDITVSGGSPTGFSMLDAGIGALATGNISIQSTGDITVSGDGRNGILAYTAGYSFSVSKTAPYSANLGPSSSGKLQIRSTGNVSTSGNQAAGIRGITVGGDVTILSSGDLATSGTESDAINARSYTGAVSVTSTGDIGTGGVLSRGISAQSNFGSVAISAAGSIQTRGYGATGIEAVHATPDTALGRSVTVDFSGDIKTSGEFSDGITAVNYGGGISVVTSGDIETSGEGSNAIRAIGYGSGDIAITVKDGTLSGGTTDAAATVAFFGGGNNTLENHGTITGGGSGWAVGGTVGAETVMNFGTISGDIQLSGDMGATPTGKLVDVNTFINKQGGIFNPAAYVDVGSVGKIINEGTLDAGGARRLARVDMYGNFEQKASGQLAVDIDHRNGKSDRIDIFGTAELSGRVVPVLADVDPGAGNRYFKILTADGGVTVKGLTITDTAVVDYTLLYPTRESVVLGVALDFTPEGLTANQNEAAAYFSGIVAGGVPQSFEAAFAALMSAPDLATYQAYLDQLYANALGGLGSAALGSGDALALALRSCPVSEGDYAQQRETSCVWAKPTVRRFDQDRSGDMADVRDLTSGLSGGFQAALGGNLWGGFAISVEDSDTLVDGKQKLDGTWVQGGGVIKWVSGGWKLSGSLTAGHAEIGSERNISLPGVALLAAADTDLDFGTGLARLSYSTQLGGLYFTPMVDLGLSYLNFGRFREHGAGAFDLDIRSTDAWVFEATPAVEIGANIASGGLTFRPYVRAGLLLRSTDNISSEASLAGAPDSTDPFTIRSEFADVLADLGAGINLFSSDGLTLRLDYQGKLGADTEVHGLDAKLTVNY